MRALNGARAAVIGLGDTGLSLARWLAGRGAQVEVSDTRTSPPGLAALRRELPQAKLRLGTEPDGAVARADIVAVSPGVDRRRGAIREAAARGVPVVGDVELFA